MWSCSFFVWWCVSTRVMTTRYKRVADMSGFGAEKWPLRRRNFFFRPLSGQGDVSGHV